MGKLTKAQRDTLVKNIQGKKIESIFATIASSIGLGVCSIIWVLGEYSKYTKFFWGLLIIGIIALGIGLNSEDERKKMQAQLDEDSE